MGQIMSDISKQDKPSNVLNFSAILEKKSKEQVPKKTHKRKPRTKNTVIRSDKGRKRKPNPGRAQEIAEKMAREIEKDPTKIWDGSVSKALSGITHLQALPFVLNRYCDNRCPESRALNGVLKGIAKDIGPDLDNRQSVLLNLLRSKLIVVMQINKYLETTPEEMSFLSGKASGVIEKTLPTYSKAISRILHELYFVHKPKARGYKTYDQILRSLRRKDGRKGVDS